LTADVTGEAKAYTTAQLVSGAAGAGFGASARLVRSWVQVGLLDQPTVRGLGRGRGVTATWPRAQADLFLDLLEVRGQGASLVELCNLPVWVWLRQQDEAVPLRQVRRALSTWVRHAAHPPWSATQTSAARVVGLISRPGTKRGVRKRLKTELASQAAGGLEAFDRDSLIDAGREAVEAGRGPRGPSGAQLDARLLADQLEAQVIGAAHLEQTTDAEFIAARQVYRATKQGYAEEYERFATDPELGNLFEEPGFTSEIPAACRDLVLVLGAQRLAAKRSKLRNA
jgi:hypothetical protein